jgi:hypothetical protein
MAGLTWSAAIISHGRHAAATAAQPACFKSRRRLKSALLSHAPIAPRSFGIRACLSIIYLITPAALLTKPGGFASGARMIRSKVFE